MKNYKDTPEGREAARLYGDIIHLSRPRSDRPRMDLTHRAKIFSPYDALNGFDEEIEDVNESERMVPKITLSDEEAELLSGKLMKLQKGMRIRVRYFSTENFPEYTGTPSAPGYYRTEEGTVLKIDPVSQVLEIRTQEKKSDTSDSGKIEKVIPTVISFSDILEIHDSPGPGKKPQ